jgi:hypothetical protein
MVIQRGDTLNVDLLLEFKQSAFAVQAAAISGQTPVRADHPMTGNDDPDRIVAVGQADRA